MDIIIKRLKKLDKAPSLEDSIYLDDAIAVVRTRKKELIAQEKSLRKTAADQERKNKESLEKEPAQ